MPTPVYIVDSTPEPFYVIESLPIFVYGMYDLWPKTHPLICIVVSLLAAVAYCYMYQLQYIRGIVAIFAIAVWTYLAYYFSSLLFPGDKIWIYGLTGFTICVITMNKKKYIRNFYQRSFTIWNV